VTRIALLDVNVLLALFDPDHVHHDVAHDWFEASGHAGWASCPITENGFLRNANVGRKAQFVPVAAVTELLRTFQRAGDHEFWNDDVSLLDEARFDADRIHGNRPITDVYLLALAVAHEGQLVTFDARIPLAAVRGARREHLVVLAPAE
jgi:uncharacterized protein